MEKDQEQILEPEEENNEEEEIVDLPQDNILAGLIVKGDRKGEKSKINHEDKTYQLGKVGNQYLKPGYGKAPYKPNTKGKAHNLFAFEVRKRTNGGKDLAIYLLNIIKDIDQTTNQPLKIPNSLTNKRWAIELLVNKSVPNPAQELDIDANVRGQISFLDVLKLMEDELDAKKS